MSGWFEHCGVTIASCDGSTGCALPPTEALGSRVGHFHGWKPTQSPDLLEIACCTKEVPFGACVLKAAAKKPPQP